MDEKPIQHDYPEDFSHCFGCGRLNERGHRLESHWEGDHATARFTPSPQHVSMPGFTYGGLIASLIDCHAMAVAAVVGSRAAGIPVGSEALLRYVTGSLKVDYLAPTPLGVELMLVGRPTHIGPRKVVSEVELSAGGVLCARGEVVAVRLPETMKAGANRAR